MRRPYPSICRPIRISGTRSRLRALLDLALVVRNKRDLGKQTRIDQTYAAPAAQFAPPLTLEVKAEDVADLGPEQVDSRWFDKVAVYLVKARLFHVPIGILPGEN